MAYSETLAQRIRAILEADHPIEAKKMFGGICFLLRGHMVCGVVGDELMVRVGPDAYAHALTKPHAREMDFTGRPMKGMIYVNVKGIDTRPKLRAWVNRGVEHAQTLPPKGTKKKATKKKSAKKKATKKKPAKKKATKKKAT